MWVYLAGLLVSLAGLATLDWRYKVAFWYDARRSALTIACAVGVFVIWDILGIGLNVFHHGNSAYSLPFRLLPEFPMEELFFLTLLCYVTLLVFRAIGRKC